MKLQNPPTVTTPNKTKLKILTQKNPRVCSCVTPIEEKRNSRKCERDSFTLDCYRTLAESVELVELEIIKRKKAHFTQGIEMLR